MKTHQKERKKWGKKNGREEEQRNLNDAGYLHLKRSQVNRKWRCWPVGFGNRSRVTQRRLPADVIIKVAILISATLTSAMIGQRGKSWLATGLRKSGSATRRGRVRIVVAEPSFEIDLTGLNSSPIGLKRCAVWQHESTFDVCYARHFVRAGKLARDDAELTWIEAKCRWIDRKWNNNTNRNESRNYFNKVPFSNTFN